MGTLEGGITEREDPTVTRRQPVAGTAEIGHKRKLDAGDRWHCLVSGEQVGAGDSRKGEGTPVWPRGQLEGGQGSGRVAGSLLKLGGNRRES